MHFIYQYYKSINPDPFGLKVWTDSDWSDLFRLRVRIDFKWAPD